MGNRRNLIANLEFHKGVKIQPPGRQGTQISDHGIRNMFWIKILWSSTCTDQHGQQQTAGGDTCSVAVKCRGSSRMGVSIHFPFGKLVPLTGLD